MWLEALTVDERMRALRALTLLSAHVLSPGQPRGVVELVFFPFRVLRNNSLGTVMVGVPRSKGCRTCLQRRVKVRSFRSSFEPLTLGFPFR